MTTKTPGERLRAMRQQGKKEDLSPLEQQAQEEGARGRRARPNRGRKGQAAKRAAAKEGGKNDLVRRVYTYLVEPVPGKRIPELDVSEERLGMFIKFLRQRTEIAEGGAAKRAERLVAYLSEDTGDPMVKGVNLKRMERLLKRMRRRLGVGKGEAGARRRPAREIAEDREGDDVEASLDQLTTATDRLARMLEESEGGERPSARQKPDSAQTDTGDDDKPKGWYREFIE